MKKFLFSFFLLTFILITSSAYAQKQNNIRPDEELNGGTVGADIVYADNETKDAVHHRNANLRHKIPARYALEDYLPILGKKARDNGVPAGFPFFVTLLYYHMEIPQIIENAKGWGESISLKESDALSATMENAQTNTNSAGFRAGFKLLPFLDIFGVFVYTKVKYGFEAKFDDRKTNIAGTINPNYVMKNTIDVNAFTGGVGLSLAYGGRVGAIGKYPVILFGVGNANVAWTKTDRTDNTISTVIAGARFGVAFVMPHNMRISLSLGYQYQQMIGWNAGSVRGSYIANLPDEAFINPEMYQRLINQDLTIEYSANSRNASNHAMNAGLVFSPCAYVDIITEFAFLSRFSAMVATNFKF